MKQTMSSNYAFFLILIIIANRPFQCIGFITLQNPTVFQKPPISSTERNVLYIDVDTVDEFFREAPYVAAFLTCSIKASSADVVVQLYETKENAEVIDNSIQNNEFNIILPKEKDFQGVVDAETINKIRRNAAFFIYGGAYQGCVQLFLINTLYPMWFGAGNDLETVIIKVLFDNFIAAPILCLPLAYTIKGLILGSTVAESLNKCWNGFLNEGLLTKYWAVWIPVSNHTFLQLR